MYWCDGSGGGGDGSVGCIGVMVVVMVVVCGGGVAWKRKTMDATMWTDSVSAQGWIGCTC